MQLRRSALLLCCLAGLARAQEPGSAPVIPPRGETTAAPAPASTPEVAPTTGTLRYVFSSAHMATRYVAMTFDDGPHPTLTPRLLDILAQRHIHATFFLIGQNAQRYPSIVKRIAAEGHEIGNHTWTHPILSKLSDERVHSELQQTADAIRAATGADIRLMRPPYGALTQRQRETVHRDFGYNIILWSVDPLDWKDPGASVVQSRIVAGVKPGAIILSHDIHKGTVDAMPATLDALAAQAYQFVTVSELLKMDQTAARPTVR